jgi:predicted peroxiredoxin
LRRRAPRTILGGVLIHHGDNVFPREPTMSEAPRSIFINLISDRPANVAKALRFGRKFLAAGWSVSLYANLDAVQVFAAHPEPQMCPVSGEPLLKLLAAFTAEGGRGLAGAECMKLAGLGAEQLPAGVEAASFPVVEAAIGADGARSITF